MPEWSPNRQRLGAWMFDSTAFSVTAIRPAAAVLVAARQSLALRHHRPARAVGIGLVVLVLAATVGCSGSAPSPTGTLTTAPTPTLVHGPVGFSATGSMVHGHLGHTATLLTNGRVLIAGGVDESGENAAYAELFDPASGTFSAT